MGKWWFCLCSACASMTEFLRNLSSVQEDYKNLWTLLRGIRQSTVKNVTQRVIYKLLKPLCSSFLPTKISSFPFLSTVAAWRSPHQSPPSHDSHSPASLCNFNQHEKEASYPWANWSFNCSSSGKCLHFVKAAEVRGQMWALEVSSDTIFQITKTAAVGLIWHLL